ncbi:hypothetical protein SLNWT_6549 [Streptomyces albus]|uniref:Uncharacterized protein n=1 Tax=Streptomyces albus (strain ATCC 21838 / DSM 41398 / FERM P-419 / JCM 4703 / NBRC 107858) TaxID=1081613 RepID=A0A0B5F5T6_STRA4|nr:hypothetical protein SLNWT_6549 [Streptomyces albus]AOU81229.1 hypothetical protein SLNHY_6538 [Streptomyces albus]AYN36924.1 hypothetical protein DUI70_6431 [Streptomyces albus]
MGQSLPEADGLDPYLPAGRPPASGRRFARPERRPVESYSCLRAEQSGNQVDLHHFSAVPTRQTSSPT